MYRYMYRPQGLSNWMIPYICGIVQFGSKTGLAHEVQTAIHTDSGRVLQVEEPLLSLRGISRTPL